MGCWKPATSTSPLFWGMDQVKQLISGHGMCTAADVAALDRLSGVLGPCNLKLGIVLASLSPFALDAAGRRFGRIGWLLAASLMGLVILLAGARAAWLTYALVLLWSGWRLLGWKRLLGVFALGVVLLAAAAMLSSPVAERLERSTAALTGNAGGRRPCIVGTHPDLVGGAVHGAHAPDQWCWCARVSVMHSPTVTRKRASSRRGARDPRCMHTRSCWKCSAKPV